MRVSLIFLSLAIAVVGKKKEEPLNRDSIPFWLVDGYDNMCLGPDGFGECGYMSLWAVASRNPTKDTNVIASLFAPEPDKMCLGSSSRGWFSSLRRVGVSKCNSGKTKNLGFTDLSVQGDSGMLLSQGKNCLARGQGRLRNSADMQPCKTGTSLALVQASIHVAGLQIRTADDYCFDGSKFRVCNDGDPTMRFAMCA